jgi:hypothetical protein
VWVTFDAQAEDRLAEGEPGGAVVGGALSVEVARKREQPVGRGRVSGRPSGAGRADQPEGVAVLIEPTAVEAVGQRRAFAVERPDPGPQPRRHLPSARARRQAGRDAGGVEAVAAGTAAVVGAGDRPQPAVVAEDGPVGRQAAAVNQVLHQGDAVGRHPLPAGVARDGGQVGPAAGGEVARVDDSSLSGPRAGDQHEPPPGLGRLVVENSGGDPPGLADQGGVAEAGAGGGEGAGDVTADPTPPPRTGRTTRLNRLPAPGGPDRGGSVVVQLALERRAAEA